MRDGGRILPSAGSRLTVTALTVAAMTIALVLAPLLAGCGSDNGREGAGRNGAEASDPGAPVDVDPGRTAGDGAGPSPGELAVRQATAEGRPVLLNFHSTTCQPCIQTEENINRVRPEYEGRVAIVIVDVYDRAEFGFCMQYNIETIPTTVFIKNDGTVSNGYVGVLEVDELKRELDALL